MIKLKIIANAYNLELLEPILKEAITKPPERLVDLLALPILAKWYNRNANKFLLKNNNTKLNFNTIECIAFLALTRFSNDLYICNLRTLIHQQINLKGKIY